MNPQLSVMTHIRGGVFTRADARACGYPDPDIDSLLDTGGWRRIRPGTYAPHQTLTLVNDEMLHLRHLYQVLRSGEPGLIASHQSAAALHALPLWGFDLSRVHVTARTGRCGWHADGVHRHVRDPVGAGVRTWNGLRLVTAARAIAELSATSALAPVVALAEAAIYAGLATQASLKRAANLLDRGVERARLVASLAGAGSASVAESRLRLILHEADLPAPSPDPPPLPELADDYATDLSGSSLWFPDERTVVEFDPRHPFWRPHPDDSLEDAARAFASSHGEPAAPEPLEYCWISWTDLDHPAGVISEVRTAFTRASRRTGVRSFPLSRLPAPEPSPA